MKYIAGHSNEITKTIKQALFEYRHFVFIQQLGWEMQTPDEYEIDQFDRDDTCYVIAKGDQGIQGCARLLPTTKPYLLKEIFPELMNGSECPESSDIWELSRFTSYNRDNSECDLKHQFKLEDSIDLLTFTLEYAYSLGAKAVISVSPIGIERLLRKAGFKAKRAGPPMIIDGYPLVACWIDLDDST